MRTSVADLSVEFALARGIGLILCELIEVVEGLGEPAPDVMVAISAEGDGLVVALAADDVGATPVPDACGLAALARAERLVRSLDGTIARGMKDDMMLFGVTLQVRDA